MHHSMSLASASSTSVEEGESAVLPLLLPAALALGFFPPLAPLLAGRRRGGMADTRCLSEREKRRRARAAAEDSCGRERLRPGSRRKLDVKWQGHPLPSRHVVRVSGQSADTAGHWPSHVARSPLVLRRWYVTNTIY